MPKVRMILGARLDDETVGRADEVHDVSPGLARQLIAAGKAVYVDHDDEHPEAGTLTSRSPAVESRDPGKGKK